MPLFLSPKKRMKERETGRKRERERGGRKEGDKSLSRTLQLLRRGRARGQCAGYLPAFYNNSVKDVKSRGKKYTHTHTHTHTHTDTHTRERIT